MVFQDEERAENIKDRLQSYTELNLTEFWSRVFGDCSDPDRALINLERWLSVTTNPRTHLAHLAESPRLAALLINLLGASQSIADGLIQNPELASVVTDAGEIANPPTREAILNEGRGLLSSAQSYAHRLDRLRYLKQRRRMPIVVADLAGAWPPEVVWRAISDLADALVELCLEIAWHEYATYKDLGPDCPIMVVAFGKLGGRELNYSSDIDLVYVLKDGVDEMMERHAARFCEMMGRALSDSMGRGSLFRVDLRLRPFGSTGPVAPTMRAVETYYRSHAELWEAQALVRSRPICGLPEMWPRWDELVQAECFQKNVSDFRFEAILETRERIEQYAPEDDLKRGPGGIRDVEFLVQILQMMHGHMHADIRAKSTLEALGALAGMGFISETDADALREGYTFLRQMEHRCQLVDDQQTHVIPSTEAGRRHLAHLMGHHSWETLETELSFQRRRIRETYSVALSGTEAEITVRDYVLGRLTSSDRISIASWFDKLPESGEFYRSLKENEGSLERAIMVASTAPSLIASLAENLPITEAIISGEVEEPIEANLPDYRQDGEGLAQAAQTQWLHRVCAWCLDEGFELGPSLSALYDCLLQTAAAKVKASFDIIALGSYGLLDAGVPSDLDVVLLAPDSVPQAKAESEAQEFLAFINGLKRHGWRIDLDLRLRPEGGQGLLVRSHQGLKSYELDRMEMWERFALGQARLVHGNPASLALVDRVAYASPLTPESLQELVKMKRRIETERVQPQHFKRDIKLGYGGITDIDWLVHLNEMRYPTALEVGKHTSSADRIRRMAQVELINAVERDQLIFARSHLLRVRNLLALLDFVPDILPENPDKLQRLAVAMELKSGYEFQKRHGEVIESVRSIYLGGLERLGV